MMYKYKIFKLNYKSKISGELDTKEVENEINTYGKDGWRLKEIQEVSISGFVYLEKEIGSKVSYLYKIVEVQKNLSNLLQIRIDENEDMLNELANNGWRLMNLFASSENHYYYFEKVLDEDSNGDNPFKKLA